MAILVLILLAVLAVALFGTGRKLYSLWTLRRRLMALVPEPAKPDGLHGHVSKDLTKYRSQLLSWVNRTPKICRIQRGPIPLICIWHPETVSQLLATDPPKFSYLFDFFKEFLGEGLVTSSGKRWQRDHKLLSPLFGGSMMRRYIQSYAIVAKNMVEQLKLRSEVGELLDTEALFQLVTFDIIMHTGIGLEVDSWWSAESSPVQSFKRAMKHLAVASSLRLTTPTKHNNFLYYLTTEGKEYKRQLSIVDEFADKLVRDRRATLDDKEVSDGEDMDGGENMVNTMLKARDEDGHGFSDAEIRDHVKTFLEAGHDTSSTVMQWAVYYLQEHQDIQERCRQEIQTVLGNSSLENMTIELLSRMEYLMQFINETLRHSTIVAMLLRCLEQETEIGGYILPPGTPVQVMLFSLHHNPVIWKDPEVFDPNRFSREHVASRPSNSFMPFGIGARSCIGKAFAVNEIKVLLMSLLLNFRILPRRPDQEKPHWVLKLVARPEPSIKVELEPL
ncbi:cytochrome P450 4F12-like [Sycon ciliatum]|uniref:cytochrome P450 4F12-like n=1 Tax=Sycon ciliatum TaxID=27933 RepID=UPI0031F60859